jgi:transglutaminase-like putative cysteine protease
MSETPVFEIQGVTQTNYIRSAVGELYQNGGWTPDPNSPVSAYSGNYIPQEITPYSTETHSSVTIDPLVSFDGNIPALLYTNELVLSNALPTSYFSNLNVFTVRGSFKSSYLDEYTYYDFNASLLQATPLASDAPSIYLEVPTTLKPCLDQVLGQIDFSQATSAYDKIIDIKLYLQANYVYDLNYTNAPQNVDPIQWFLLTEKRGVCANFNSAFAMLLREEGIPSRVVAGYSIDGSASDQIVRQKQAHEWAEVEFQNIGWVEFDATGHGALPSPQQVDTKTIITSVSPSAVKGGLFVTKGIVTDLSGNPASGLTVAVYLMKNKDDATGIMCGSSTTANDGTFSITTEIPATVSVGDYQVVAKTLGDDEYSGSQSDPTLTVNAQTLIRTESADQAVIDEPFSLTAQLTENFSGLPIANQPLLLTYTANGENNQISGVTNQSGYANLNFASIPDTSDNNIQYTISFVQSGFYLATSTNGELILAGSAQPHQSTPNQGKAGNSSLFIYEVASTAIVIGVTISILAALFYRKKRAPVQTLGTNKESALMDAIQSPPKNSGTSLSIVFPRIKSPFPDVWGVNEAFEVQFKLGKNSEPISGELEVQIGSEPAKRLTTNTDGIATIELNLPTKGSITLRAKHSQTKPSVSAQRNLRIVDYTEEIVAVFKEVYEFGKGSGLKISKDTSPREFQRRMLNAFNEQKNISLEEAVTMFEVADYSLYTLNRPDYERMFLSSISLKQQLSSNSRCDG